MCAQVGTDDQQASLRKDKDAVGEWTIYGLVDPRDARIRYVGCSAHPKDRAWMHAGQARIATSPKSVWMRELEAAGLKPLLVAIEVCESEKEAADSERKWIASLPGLCNVANGGFSGRTSKVFEERAKPEYRSRQSAAMLRHVSERRRRRVILVAYPANPASAT